VCVCVCVCIFFLGGTLNRPHPHILSLYFSYKHIHTHTHTHIYSRCFETFGEDPYVIGQFAKTVIEGIQGPHEDFPDLPPASATMKHFIAYGNSRSGHDRGPVEVRIYIYIHELCVCVYVCVCL
jgi:hypothetical protein